MNDDDDDSIFNLVLQLQRYDDGDAPEVQSTQPVEHLLHTALFLYYSLMDTRVISPPKQDDSVNLNSQDTPKISKHFHEIDTKRD